MLEEDTVVSMDGMYLCMCACITITMEWQWIEHAIERKDDRGRERRRKGVL